MIRSSDLLVWGNNQCGLLSKSNSKCISTPMPLSLPYDIISICASQKHISFVTRNGQLYSYGSNLDGRLGISTKLIDDITFTEPIKVQINGRVLRAESGFSHMCILTDKMELYSWGLGDYGALGTGEFKFRSTPTKVDLQREIVTSLRQISCGAMHTAFLTQDGDVYACGSNQYGEIGNNQPQKVATPTLVSFHFPVRQISCGVFYTLLLTREGRVFGMGNNKYGQLGIGHKMNQYSPTMIKQLNEIVKVTAGYHSGAIDSYGNLYIWGSGSFGEILKPKKYVLSIPIRDVAIRGFFGIAIGHTSKNQNRIYCWGNNTFGELGLGNYEPSKEPEQLEILRGLQINKVALGVNFAMVLLHQPKSLRGWDDEQLPGKYIEQYNDQFYGSSGRRSIVGFQQSYLNTNRIKNQDSYQGAYRRKDHQFQKYGHISRNKSKRTSFQKNSRPSLSPINSDRHYPVNQRRSYKLIDKIYQGEDCYSSQPLTHPKDYEHLFLNLSGDYENLTQRYKELQKQLQILKAVGKQTVEGLQKRQKQLLQENVMVKEQVSKLRYELMISNDEKKTKIRKNDIPSKQKQNERPVQQTLQKNVVQIKNIQVDIQQQYNKLLTHKEQLIKRLDLSITKAEEQHKLALAQINNQNISLKNQLSSQIQNNKKIKQEDQSVINELEVKLKQSVNIINLLKQQNENKKAQNSISSVKNIQFQEIQSKNKQMQSMQQFMIQKYQKTIKDSQLRSQTMSNRIAQLQVQLKYEKDFNLKYQECINQMKTQNEKLHHELGLQHSTNVQNNAKIQNYLIQVESYKKYKKQLDQRNMEVEQLLQSLQQNKKKSKSLINQKDQAFLSQQDNTHKIIKQYQDKIEKKNYELQQTINKNYLLESQVHKIKQNVTTFKNNIAAKDDQLQHLYQLKINMQKKINRLNDQITKSVQENDAIVKDSGESKRQLTRLKLANADLQSQRDFQLQQKAKSQQLINDKTLQLSHAKQQLKKLTQYCDNIAKQNKLIRLQNQQIRHELQSQQKINDELVKANRQFANNQSEFTKRNAQLQAKIFQLQSQNKSYAPRYDALLVRNKQLDQRNRQLSQMINKAIQFQAQSYKNNILKQVQMNTDHIINQIKQQKQFKPKNNRNKNKPKENAKLNEEQQNSMKKNNQNCQIILKEEPYTKMMKQRINQHKRKVSESAQKLVSILQLNENEQKSPFKGLSSIREHADDYQKINMQMESFSNKKQEFIQKIHSFAEKLKII